jgi:hypothetical protein
VKTPVIKEQCRLLPLFHSLSFRQWMLIYDLLAASVAAIDFIGAHIVLIGEAWVRK